MALRGLGFGGVSGSGVSDWLGVLYWCFGNSGISGYTSIRYKSPEFTNMELAIAFLSTQGTILMGLDSRRPIGV